MKAQQRTILPLARSNEIVTKEIDGELLIYDRASDKAHCLNSSAAKIWKLCDGRTTVPEMVVSINTTFGVPVDDTFIHSALQQLNLRALLAEGSYVRIEAINYSRRSLARKLGIAIFLLPIITSINAPSALAAVSCGGGCSGGPGRGTCPAGCLCSGITNRCVVA